MLPIACMISDRRRLADPTPGGLVQSIGAAAAAGVQLIQLREPDLEGRPLGDLVVRAVAAVRGTRARIVINDRLDVALACGAHGVHLRGSSFKAARVRAVVPAGFIIGQSVHSADDAAGSGDGIDYFLFGHVFETASKPAMPAAGLTLLSDVVRATPIPVLALGGITRERIAEVLAAGASGYAGISLFLGEHPANGN